MTSLERRIRRGAQGHAHSRVADVAREMASAIFEEAMSKSNDLFNGLRRDNPDDSTEQLRRKFVQATAPHLLEAAQAQLVEMLGRPDLSEAVKDEIYESILRDKALARGPGNKVLTPRTHHFN